MSAFLLTTLSLDCTPPPRPQSSYPGVTILVPAYNEADAITETLESLAVQHYLVPSEVLVLNDGSIDDTVARAERALHDLHSPAATAVHIHILKTDGGKSAVHNAGLLRRCTS